MQGRIGSLYVRFWSRPDSGYRIEVEACVGRKVELSRTFTVGFSCLVAGFKNSARCQEWRGLKFTAKIT